MEPQADLRELESEVRAAVERLGGRGVVRASGGVVTLVSGGAEVSLDASALIGGWSILSPALRQRQVDDLARRLLSATSAAGATGASASGSPAPGVGPHALGEADAKVVQREIQSAVRDVLAAHGTGGVATVRGTRIELYAGGEISAFDLGTLPDQWPLLPDDIRSRRIAEVARRLVAAHRAGGTPISQRKSGPRVVAIPLGALVLLAILGAFGLKLLSASGWGRGAPAPTGPVPETEEQAAARRAHACEAARKRIFSGATVGAAEMEGWFVELWLAAPRKDLDLERDPALTALVESGKLATGADPELAGIAGGTLEIAPGLEPDRAERSPAWRAAILRFGGGYVGAFVDPARRPRFLGLADRVADATHAEVGALYARCTHLGFHDMGAWFRGADASAAVAALLYAAGSFTESPAVDRTALARIDAKVDGGGELSAIRAAAGKMDHLALATLISAQGGGVARAAPGTVTVTFPVGGGTRALSASRTVARKLGVGVE